MKNYACSNRSEFLTFDPSNNERPELHTVGRSIERNEFNRMWDAMKRYFDS